MAPPPGRRRRLNCGPAPAGPGAPQAACAADSANAADSAPRAAGAGLAALLAPLGLPEFLTRHFGRAPLVLRGRPERAALAAALVSFERVIEAAAAGPARRRGSILMHLHHLPPAALDRLTHELARSLGADVWPNIYATGGAGTALDFHFDAHEVLALQCEGRKEWRVSRVRADRPLDLPALAASLRGTLEALRARALEETLFVETLDPGDLLYLPRSQFHNARSAAGRSLHVSFGIAPLSGIDAIEALAALALGDPALRDWLPLPGEDAHRMARRARLAGRGRRMSAARVLLVGWDGADGDIVRPLIETGALPRLRGIVEAGVMVSEGFPGLGATGDALPAGAVQPAHLAAALAEMRVQPAELDAGALREFVPDLGRDGAGPDAGDPRLAALRLILADAVSVHAAATWLMQNEAWSLFAVRYRALGAFSHGYMRDRAPAEGGDARYGGVVEAAYRFHDMMLGAPLAGDIEGRVLAEAFYAPPPAPAARPSAAGARTPEERGAGAAPPDAVPADPAPADPADERQLALARVHLDAGRAAAALPGDPRSALLLHGAVLIERGRVDEGLARLAQAERIELLSAALLTEIGRLYLCCGRPAEAARALARAVASGAGSGAAQEMLAESLLALGLVARAADAALGAVRLRHDSQRAHALFAETLARLGDHERAAAHRAIARELAGRAPLNRAPA